MPTSTKPKATRTKRSKTASKTRAAASVSGNGRRKAAKGGSPVVIVESPTKARTIRAFLPPGYRVEASMGHIRDLPQTASAIPPQYKGQEWARLGVNVERDFEPLYVVPQDKKPVVRELKAAVKEASEVILATDEDREGESISWHLLQVLEPKVPVRRMVFHEITREAIREALEHTRDVDEQLVRAQETRRILDRLVGYTISPLLWKKIASRLSAGRVQSVAMRLLVLRERERRAFRAATYWDLAAELAHDGQGFKAQLATVGGKKVASGRDFDEHTGKLIAGRDVILLDGEQARALREELLRGRWTVAGVEEKPLVRRPAAPFITSTLQQEANRKLRLSARDTMRVAQSLYEQGYITYMRTDSVHLSEQAIRAARAAVTQLYGKEYLADGVRRYTNKNDSAQEAHEAIRPAGEVFRTPAETGLEGRELALYDLIWKRTVASQMADSRQTAVSVVIEVMPGRGEALAGPRATFRASGKRIDFAGFLRAYVEGSDDPDQALEDQEVILPPLEAGDLCECLALEALAHETQPPARYTEATLIKTLEAEGVGRPSTYASIIDTILDRGYAVLRGQALVPTFTAFAVTKLLERHFSNLVDTGFTAKMEQALDDIAEGKEDWLPYLRQFYLGREGLKEQVAAHESAIDPAEARTIELEGLDHLDARVKIGPFGPYVEVDTHDGRLVRASLPQDVAPADLADQQIESLIRQKTDGPEEIARHPETGEPIFLLTGQYGPYLQLGEATETNPKPRRASLPRGVEPSAVTPGMAVGLLSLPRLLGHHPETGRPIKAGLGRFGPYVVHEGSKQEKADFRSLKAGDDVLTIGLERALELLAQPRQMRGRRAAPEPLRVVGAHPADNQPIGLYEGKYGPYVKHGTVSASIPKDRDPASITLEEAVELLAARAGRGKGRARGARKTSRRAAAS
ncbi:MAG: type I DNA topoisomerase [Gemmatimonadota bacterium]